MSHNHSHAHTAIRATWFSIIGNTLVALMKVAVGFFGNSFALIADAIESTTDIFSSILVMLGLRYASRPPDKLHPYGHGRAEPLMTFIVVGFLIFSASVIAYQSIVNIRNPHDLPQSYTLWFLAVIIAWKEISFRFVMKKSKETNSSSLKADAWHHRSDALTSVAAFIGISIALIFGEGYEAADDWAALSSSAFILYNCYHIFRPALGEIMDENVYHEMEERIRTIAMTVEGVTGTEKCLIRKTGMTYQLELHANVNGDITVRAGHDISHKLKDKLKDEIPELANVTIHIEPYISISSNA
ncbi:MAG TPA: cation diffusion facilitator family transporter [Cyclobacteriaceae bacterium]|nr:cation diffusion facilitator family transporter [Cyclobacteriaceae bacterium]